MTFVAKWLANSQYLVESVISQPCSYPTQKGFKVRATLSFVLPFCDHLRYAAQPAGTQVQEQNVLCYHIKIGLCWKTVFSTTPSWRGTGPAHCLFIRQCKKVINTRWISYSSPFWFATHVDLGSYENSVLVPTMGHVSGIIWTLDSLYR